MTSPKSPTPGSLREIDRLVIERLKLMEPDLYQWLITKVNDTPPNPIRGRKRPRYFQTLSDIRSVARGLRHRYSLAERIEIIRRVLEED
jgi:hypothetical protein